MADKPKMTLILEHSGMGGLLELWACRGEAKGCTRHADHPRKTHCEDCFGPLPPNMTMGEVLKRVEEGDA